MTTGKSNLVAMVASVLAVAGCTDEDRSRRILHEQGYRDVHISGYALWQCGRDDTFATEFSAATVVGLNVSGAVCCGVLKGCTVRLK